MNEATRHAQFTDYTAAKLPGLRRFAYVLCQDWHRADDLVQIAVTRLYMNWDRVDQSGNSDGYLRKILVNAFLDERRSPWWRRVALHRARDGAEPEGPADPARQPFAALPDVDGALDLNRALQRLTPRQRATLVLRYYCDLTVAETSRLLGCTDGTVKSQTARALDTLRQQLSVPTGPGSQAPSDPSSRRRGPATSEQTAPEAARPATRPPSPLPLGRTLP